MHKVLSVKRGNHVLRVAFTLFVGCTILLGMFSNGSSLTAKGIEIRISNSFEVTLGTEYTVTGLNSNNWGAGPVVISVSDETRYQIRRVMPEGMMSSWGRRVIEDEETGMALHYYEMWDKLNGETSEPFGVWFGIDKKIPAISSFNFELGFNDGKTHNHSFGLFSKQSVKVTVKATDPDASSGIGMINLYYYDEDGVFVEEISAYSTDLSNGNVVFYLPVGLKGSVKAKAIDGVGNESSEVLATKSNSNLLTTTGYIEIENTLPENFTINVSPLPGVEKNPFFDVYGGDVEVDFSVSDINSGLLHVDVLINGASYAGFPKIITSKTTNANYSIETSGLPAGTGGPFGLGSYVIKVVVTDNAGNVREVERTIYKDTIAPEISGLDFDKTEFIEHAGLLKDVNSGDYNFYFRENTVVKIFATDVPLGGITDSTVSSITYKVVDTEGTTVYQGTKSVVDDAISFTINKAFKGQIYAYATDSYGNTLKNTGTSIGNYMNGDGYGRLGGIIIEDSNRHSDTSAIAITPSSTSWQQNNKYSYSYSGSAVEDKILDYDDSNNVPLYNGDTGFKVVLDDTYSGIRKVKWTVIEDSQPNVVKTIDVDNDGLVIGDNSVDWQVVKENNIVTKLTNNDLRVSGNSNNMVLLIELTDRSGNVSYDYYIFGIDKTAPVISVSYDNNSAENEKYFKENRVATITIEERNFSSSDVVVNITNTDGTIPTLSNWTSADGITHTASLTYSADGDYTFDISCKDNAQNENVGVNYGTSVKPQEFTIDKTKPVVRVTYDNNDVKNGMYYNSDRKATITVTEHNFDASRVIITGTASNDGRVISFPSTTPWVSNGDVHTATIEYTKDGKYSFDILVIDLAGNESVDFTPNEFVIDKTKPSISITGVRDKSAYKGNVIPVISFSDTNYDKQNKTVSLSAEKNGDVPPNGRYSNINRGQAFTFANFEKVQEMDDVYTLTASTTDLAGNKTTETIMFSVNRFGSTYIFSDSLKTTNGKYVKEEIDVVVTEINVSRLKVDKINVKRIMNGAPVDLVKGTDFSVREVEGGIWNSYEYRISKSVFSSEGSYSVVLYSEDVAGNVNENTDERKNSEITFGIDKTSPIITSFDLSANKQYPVSSKTASFAIKDNLVLESVKIYINGKEAKLENNGETYTIEIPESNSKRNVKVVAVDAAGNEAVLDMPNILVTTNWFARWYNNSLLFYGSLTGIFLVAGALFIFFKRKKREEEDN